MSQPGEFDGLVKKFRLCAKHNEITPDSELCGMAATAIQTLQSERDAAVAEVTKARPLSDYDYNELWDAIAKATRIEGGAISISVRTFRAALETGDTSHAE